MVAESAGVVANHRHRLVFNFTFVKIEVRSALKNVAGIDQKRVRVFLPDEFHKCRAPRYPAFIWIALIVFRKSLRVGMKLNCRLLTGTNASARYPAGRGSDIISVVLLRSRLN